MPERSPEGVAHLPQSRLLPMLLEVATALGGPACVRFGRAVAGVRQTPSGVVVTLEADAQVHCLPVDTFWKGMRTSAAHLQTHSGADSRH